MKLTTSQYEFIKELLPAEEIKSESPGRPYKDPKDVLEGILWILKTGARWKDLPSHYPPYQTCHRRFQTWIKTGLFKKILERLIEHLKKEGRIDLTETFIDAMYVDAQKGGLKLAQQSEVRGLKLWQSSIIQVFLSAYPLKVLHSMRVSLLKERLGKDISKSFLVDLSETKLTIVIYSTSAFDEDLKSHSLLPISRIEKTRLKMAELLEDTERDGK